LHLFTLNGFNHAGISNGERRLLQQIMFSFTLLMKGQWILIKYLTQYVSVASSYFQLILSSI